MAGFKVPNDTQDELANAKRLPVLNYRSRCYLLALLAEIECQILREDDQSALKRIEDEQQRVFSPAERWRVPRVPWQPENPTRKFFS